MTDINVTLPDGNRNAYPAGTTPLAIAQRIGERLARDALVANVDGTLVDLTTPLTTDSTLEILTFADPRGKEVFWHTSAHILAQAVLRLFPEALPTIGPPIEHGFYYDFAHLNISEEDLARIEEEMRNIAKEDLRSERKEYLSKADAKRDYTNTFKHAIIDDAEGGLSAYQQGEFLDFCRGPHIPRTGLVKAVWLTRIAGAYWKGDAKNAQLTRIYGITFPDTKQLKAHQAMIEEAKKRDHRKIGAEMELYAISEEVGPGLIFWLPKGNVIKEELEQYAKEVEEAWGYQRVTTPLVTKEGLFHTSEHLPHYADSMYAPMNIDNETYYIKPMNCPFHHLIFKVRTRSYRELPLRLAEYGWCHRYEQSGAVFGLMRVRAMQMNDAHIYCAKEDAVKEFLDVIKLHEEVYQKLGITEYSMELALRDPKSDKYHGDESMWQEAEQLMREAMEQSGVPYTIDIGGAAFYGPKIDFQVKSAIGRTFSASTNQIDLFMPEKFGLKYIGEDGQEHTPVCIHRAPLGTHERFIGFLIEHFAGRFPLWLAPEQVAVLPISEEQESHAKVWHEELRKLGIRSVLETGDTLNKRIRDCQLRRVPAMLIVGQKEVDTGTVALRTLDGNTAHNQEWEATKKRFRTAITERNLTF